ncbi:MAG TPA: hypothetical protein VMV83_15860 [Rectinemataceae bacterium]|nr:hypothetical protein [Rectinemataceae bacterium]
MTESPLARPRRRRLGDRADGRLLRSLNPFYRITPYIMRTRVDAQDYFTDRIEIDRASAWLRGLREGGHRGIGFLHLYLAALVRTMSQRPRLNRFVAGQKIYARNDLTISLAIKKRLHEDSPETTVKLRFDPQATIFDVAVVLEAALGENKKEETRNDTDKTARLFMLIPGTALRLLMWLLRSLDYVGLLPRVIRDASPFHTSAFVTDLGSLGVKPIYHHLYDFGTTSLFVAFGMKEREFVLDAKGSVVERKYMTVKIVNDERICDGHYYASAFRYFLGLLRDPEQLEQPPEALFDDVD